MKIDFVERQAVRVACLRDTGSGGEPLGRFWHGTVAPWLAHHGLIDCPRYGVLIDDPPRTAAHNSRYDACIELPPGLSLPEVAETVIHGGRYAITFFRGTGVQIGFAWDAFIAAVLANPGVRRDGSRPPFEHMPRGAVYGARTGVFCCELCLPVTG